MEWTRSETLALAAPKCATCHGAGLMVARRSKKLAPCSCVLRAIFRACYVRFKNCVQNAGQVNTARLEYRGSGQGRGGWGMKEEEYVADFCLVTRRTLTEEQYRIFRYHFLLGADWRLCCRKLNVDRGSFFHEVYRIESRLGRVFRELEPYSLYPLDEYFGIKVQRGTEAGPGLKVMQFKPVRPPVPRREPGVELQGLADVIDRIA